ncbi:hypothetical protein D3C87_2188840 [compost metagenome]
MAAKHGDERNGGGEQPGGKFRNIVEIGIGAEKDRHRRGECRQPVGRAQGRCNIR